MTKRTEAFDAWYDIQDQRTEEVRHIIEEGYGGSIDRVLHDDPVDVVSLPDSSTMRVEVNGKGLRDFVLNFPYVFEVVEPDDIDLSESVSTGGAEEEIIPPLPLDSNAPAICVIDSGIQEGHLLLEPAIDKPSSYCFLSPPEQVTDVADYVRPGGHGTRVAGAVLYGERVQRDAPYQLPFWIQNARVLDADRILDGSTI